MENFVKFKKLDDEKQLAFGEVYIPDIPDSQGDFMTADEIEKMAHKFMKSGAVNQIDTEHDLETNGSVVVESFIARKGDPDFIEGAWVVGIWAPDEVWEQLKKGELGGFSMFGAGVRTEKIITVEIPDTGVIKGETLLDDHHDDPHVYVIRFDLHGNFLGGETNPHSDGSPGHKIVKGTVTELAGSTEHRHRFSFLDALVTN